MTAGQAAGRALASSPARSAALVAGAVALAAVGWLAWSWFRESALVQVRHVQVQGVSGREAQQIRLALEETGKQMTTLHVRDEDLRRAVSPYPSVRSLSVETGFPSTLRVSVDQRVAVAVLAAGERRLAVAADGTVLTGHETGELPQVAGGQVPQDGTLAGRPLVLARVLGGAPAALRPELDRAWAAGDGVRIALRAGLVIRFGSPDRRRAKWAAATRLLAARATVGADTIDVRLPERPTAQFDEPGAEEAVAGVAEPAITDPADPQP
jgi:cell division protein FtsQ